MAQTVHSPWADNARSLAGTHASTSGKHHGMSLKAHREARVRRLQYFGALYCSDFAHAATKRDAVLVTGESLTKDPHSGHALSYSWAACCLLKSMPERVNATLQVADLANIHGLVDKSTITGIASFSPEMP